MRVQLRTAKLNPLEETIIVTVKLDLIQVLEQNPSHADARVRGLTTSSFTDSQFATLEVVEELRQEVKTFQVTVQNMQATHKGESKPLEGKKMVLNMD